MEHTVHLIDLTFLPDEFFNLTSHHEVGAIYTRMMGNPQTPGAGKFNNFSMNWEVAPNFGVSFRFPKNEINATFFVEILDHFLKLFYGKKGDKIDTWREWALGFLSTAKENPQDPHVDYTHQSMKQYLDNAGVLPCSFDLPLIDGGMRLSIYGLDGPDTQKMCWRKISLDAEVPAKHMLIWR